LLLAEQLPPIESRALLLMLFAVVEILKLIKQLLLKRFLGVLTSKALCLAKRSELSVPLTNHFSNFISQLLRHEERIIGVVALFTFLLRLQLLLLLDLVLSDAI